MSNRKAITIFYFCILLCANLLAQNTQKPWTRWWWFGNTVTEQGITSALEAYKKAGLGGVEITPIYGVKGEEKNFIEYLSPAWMEKLAYTLNEAKRLGLGVDMTNASGWPFGGAWVSEETAAKYFAAKTFTVKGGEIFTDSLKFIQKPLVRTQGSPDALDQVRKEKDLPLIALIANKKGKNGFSQSIDLTDKIQNGILRWKAPKGEWLVCALFEGDHGKMVERAGPGGDGLVIDHFSDKALGKYLEKFDKAFRGYDLSYLRCFFNDSYEVDDASGEANFTPELFAEFEKRNHYRLENYLPALLGLDSEENNRRIIYDYRTTIGELLLDRFTIPWRDWAKQQGKQIRNQAHGSPANILDLYAASDIPEIEGSDIVNLKAAASAAHVSGKNLVSSETATWLNEHFESTLGDVKNAVDKMFLAGVNHVFYHGTTYSPPDAPFPGWLFYAAVHFTPQNTFWDDFGTLNKYVENTQRYLQAGKPANDILLYFPVADLWSEPATNGNFLQHFHSDRLFNHTSLKICGDYLTNEGYSWDAVSDKQLQNNNLQSYKLVFVPQTKYMNALTFEKLVQMAQNGIKVIFYKNLPEDVPGVADLQRNKKTFIRLLKAARKSSNIIVLNDLSAFGKYSGISPESFYKNSLQSVRRQKTDGGYYYFIKNCRDTAFENYISLNVEYASANILNPMNGKSGLAQNRKTGGQNEIYLQLKAQESLIIETFNEKHDGEKYPFYRVAGEKIALSGEWTIEFVKGGPTLPPKIITDKFGSWTNFGAEYAAFSGTAEYKTVIPALSKNYDAWLLDLSTVNSSAAIYLNGKHIQTLINAPFAMKIPINLLKGNDTLAIRVANLMANRISDMDKKGIPYRIFQNTNFNALNKKNVGKDGKFTAINWKPKDSGIIGTVTLTPMNDKSNDDKLPGKQEVLQTMQRVNQYFMDKYDYYSPSNVGKLRPSNIWTRGVYYEGLMALLRIFPKEEYHEYALNWAEFHRWGLHKGDATRNADNQCCGQTYIDLYQISPAPEKIQHIKSCIDMVVNSPQNDDWSWIDAIQMAMPVFARLGKMTGDNRYFEKMYQMYSFTRNNHGKQGLFNTEEGLWWRDSDFVPPYKEPNGRNCYWSRGNGWVYAALAQVLSIIPYEEPHREEYVADFIAMSKALKDCQREDGFWNVSLHDPTHFGGKEASGTALFVYGIAYGINASILDREIYLPTVSKAWTGLCNEAVHPDGFLGYVQGTGKEPKDAQPVTYDKIPDFEDFGIGCFLLGASEIFNLASNKK